MNVVSYPIILVVVYLSLVIGAYIKFMSYGLGPVRSFWSLLTPFILLYIGVPAVFIFAKNDKEQKNLISRIVLFLRLIIISVKWLPLFVGGVALSLKNSYAKADARVGKHARKGKSDFKFRSFTQNMRSVGSKLYKEDTGILQM